MFFKIESWNNSQGNNFEDKINAKIPKSKQYCWNLSSLLKLKSIATKRNVKIIPSVTEIRELSKPFIKRWEPSSKLEPDKLGIAGILNFW